jgi:hypothetical protein
MASHALDRAARLTVPLVRPDILRGFTWKRFLVFLAVVLAFSTWGWSGVLFSDKVLPFSEHMLNLLLTVQRTLLTYAPIYLLVTLADGLPVRGWARKLALFAALLVGTMSIVQMRCLVIPDRKYEVYFNKKVNFCRPFPSLGTFVDFPYLFTTPFFMAGLSMLFIFGRRRDAELAAAVHSVRASQVEARRRRIEADLQAMQARIEPDFLFATLADIRALYETDARAGDELLDHLIAYLRSALPQMRGAGLTVEQELALLQAWLEIEKVRSNRALAFALDVPPALRGAHLPPMVLLPLASQVLHVAGAQAIEIRVSRVDRHVEVAVCAPAASDAPAARRALESIRSRLVQVYGGGASLRIEPIGADRVCAVLEVPHEQP